MKKQYHNLSEEKYWDELYKKIKENGSINCRLRSDAARLSWWQDLSQDYSKYLINKLYERFFPKEKGLSIVEIGSAPGYNLLEFSKRFGYTPYGIEYTLHGVELNRKIFLENQIPSENIIHADFFDQNFQEKYKNYFDIVTSFGFVEHFDNPKEIIRMHLNILKEDGLLVVMIPNFRYMNYYLKCFFNTNFIKTHNLSLIELDTFKNSFLFDNCKILKCSYIGGFKFPQPTYTLPWKRLIEKALGKIQPFLDVFFRIFFGEDGFENHFSSSLVYVGKKLKSG